MRHSSKEISFMCLWSLFIYLQIMFLLFVKDEISTSSIMVSRLAQRVALLLELIVLINFMIKLTTGP